MRDHTSLNQVDEQRRAPRLHHVAAEHEHDRPPFAMRLGDTVGDRIQVFGSEQIRKAGEGIGGDPRPISNCRELFDGDFVLSTRERNRSRFSEIGRTILGRHTANVGPSPGDATRCLRPIGHLARPYIVSEAREAPTAPRHLMTQFFWNLLLAGVVVLIATRVGVVLDRDTRLSITIKWAILIAIVVAVAFFLSLLRRFEP